MEVDLFGDPVLPPKEGRGRPAHQPTPVTRNRVLLCLVRGLTLKETATVIGVSVPTLREHYFVELEQRKIASLKMEMRQLERLNTQAEGGNVAAEKELWNRLEKLRLRGQAEAIGSKRKAKAAPRKGKKEEQAEAAQGVGGRFGTRAPPPGMLQ